MVKKNKKSTYINASYVRGFGSKSTKTYIAAQGPLDTTVEAFLRMLHEKKIEVCLMATGIMEGGKKKCARYFPEKVGEKVCTMERVWWRFNALLLNRVGIPSFS
jgi:protein tyrosine phosphatase